MFGYVKPHDPYLYKKDDVLYRALYCGMCKSIGATCGQMARLSLTYDIAFLSAIAHNIVGTDVKIERKHCIIHPITKRPVASRTVLADKLAAVNVLLAKYKIADDRRDGKKSFFRGLFLRRGYNKAKKICPKADEIISKYLKEQFDLESSDNGTIDRLSDPSAKMLAEISDEVLGEYKTKESYDLFYYVGKWIYVIDALDDYDKDVKKNEYNVFRVVYGAKSLKELIAQNSADVDFLLGDIFNGISKNFSVIKFNFNADLVANILLKGIPQKTKSVLEEKVC